ncbi:MAG TPA: sugar phosphate isomerase/epimerase [Candidatus Bathyarchaeia archaeon]|nr:sugar phosphate isomerase/epimerase [Candidatus Bathyarchaeia archaeon]
MLYGVSSAIELNVEEFIARAATTFAAIELVSEFPHVHHSTPKVRELLELKRSYDLTYTMHAPFCSVNLASINPKLRNASLNEILSSIPYASELGCELVVVHPGIVSYPRNLHKFERISKENERDSFFRICEKAESEKTLVCVENMPRFPPAFKETWTGDAQVELVDEMQSRFLQVALDVGHCNTTDVPIPQMIHKFGSRIKHVHIHDNDGFRETHGIVGQGSIPWREVIKALSDIGYDRLLIDEHRTLEGQKRGRDYLQPIIQAFR